MDLDPYPVFKFLWIRIRFSNFLDPDTVSAPGYRTKKKNAERALKLFIRNHNKIDESLDPDPVCPERMDLDPVNIKPDPKPCC